MIHSVPRSSVRKPFMFYGFSLEMAPVTRENVTNATSEKTATETATKADMVMKTEAEMATKREGEME